MVPVHHDDTEVRSTLSLTGDLKDFGLLQLLSLMQVTGKTGSLTLERRGETATLFFRNGELLQVRTPASRSESLPAALLRAGRIDREQHQQIESGAPASEKAAALFMTDQGILSREEIVQFVRERSIAGLYRLITWLDGSFRVEIDALPPDEDITASTDIASILEKGQSYLDEWRKYFARVPDLSKNIRLLPQPRDGAQEIKLSLAEWQTVVSLARKVSLVDIAERMELDDLQIRKMADELISAGLAELDEPQPDTEVVVQEVASEFEEERAGGFWAFGKRK
jgi:hypothetical protein